jgi:NADPH2:quinone reductase
MMRKNIDKEGIPGMMRSVRQHSAGGALVIESIPVPEPGPGEVLVRMAAAPINPSDLAALSGKTHDQSWPFTPGLEGSGIVVGKGKGLFPALRMGKRVACSPNSGEDGTWAEYMKTSAMKTVPLPGGISQEQGAMMLVNPMTAMAFIQMAIHEGHPAMVNNAAASALGKMLIRLADHYSIPLINIVRNQAQVIPLKGMGATHVLNSSDPSFDQQLHDLSGKLGATLILDAVTGRETQRLLQAVPDGSTLVAYARLSGDPIQADPADLIKHGKKITGFQLGDWLSTKNTAFKLRLINRVKKQLSGCLFTHVQATFSLQEVEQAISLYRENMSKGKVLLVNADLPDQS